MEEEGAGGLDPRVEQVRSVFRSRPSTFLLLLTERCMQTVYEGVATLLSRYKSGKLPKVAFPASFHGGGAAVYGCNTVVYGYNTAIYGYDVSVYGISASVYGCSAAGRARNGSIDAVCGGNTGLITSSISPLFIWYCARRLKGRVVRGGRR
eukprot:3513884-Rhodomonas_salina.4